MRHVSPRLGHGPVDLVGDVVQHPASAIANGFETAVGELVAVFVLEELPAEANLFLAASARQVALRRADGRESLLSRVAVEACNGLGRDLVGGKGDVGDVQSFGRGWGTCGSGPVIAPDGVPGGAYSQISRI